MTTSVAASSASAEGSIVAPASSYSPSRKHDPSPAPDATQTSTPFLTNRLTVSGTIATRFSPDSISFRTATLIYRLSRTWLDCRLALDLTLIILMTRRNPRMQQIQRIRLDIFWAGGGY